MNRDCSSKDDREKLREVGWLFWDCDLEQMDLTIHRDFIIERILDRGTLPAVRWLFRVIGENSVRDFLIGHGYRLRRDVFHFWRLYFGIPEDLCTKRSSLKTNEMLWPF